ncbi:unnamed protein product [Plutella xylostella]|uniref:(diamondback moth) hypothetical protein n=1 Tax=Plutella xylostella TaxID=51655 RepID=A0A8S4FW81_PLUXY|nr:unnamed protein product [Plutella xylostella]
MSAGERRCGAPRVRTTWRTQCGISTAGFTGRSWYISDNSFAFLVNLETKIP